MSILTTAQQIDHITGALQNCTRVIDYIAEANKELFDRCQKLDADVEAYKYLLTDAYGDLNTANRRIAELQAERNTWRSAAGR